MIGAVPSKCEEECCENKPTQRAFMAEEEEQVDVAASAQSSAQSSEASTAPEQDYMGAEPPAEVANMAEGDIFGDGMITLKQEFAVLELFGCEAKNRYRVMGAAAGPMYITEQSDCMERICCGPQRSAVLTLHLGTTKEDPVVMTMHKKFHCLGNCPCLRPHMDVTGADGSHLGHIHDPCRICCIADNQAFDSSGAHVFSASGCECQPGMCGPPLACCFPAHFPVTNQRTGSTDGELRKRKMDLAECCLNLNTFEIDFPTGTDANDKALLVAQMMLMDFQYFEMKDGNQGGGGGM